VYGPFRYDGRYTSDSNREFDRMLQDRDPNSGLRDIREVTALALHAWPALGRGSMTSRRTIDCWYSSKEPG
jgi:hypothetical protein